MFRVTTESGAVYLIDPETQQAARLSGPEVANRTWNDGEWERRELQYPLEVGVPMVLISGTAEQPRRRITTAVERIEVADEWKEQ